MLPAQGTPLAPEGIEMSDNGDFPPIEFDPDLVRSLIARMKANALPHDKDAQRMIKKYERLLNKELGEWTKTS